MKWIKHPWLFLLLSFVITLIIKIPHLGYPFSWDETFSYYPAVLEMVKNGPGMLPGAISLVGAKGHPLLFSFITSVWVKFIAGNSIVMIRIFPVIISLFALYVFHRFAKRHINIIAANVCVLILSLQALFLAQASLVLPELLLFSLLILSFDSYLSCKYISFAIFSTLMVLTKETGLVFLMVFGLSFQVENRKAWKTIKFRKDLLLISIAAIIYALFLLLHKLEFGCFFYHEHINYLTIHPTKLLDNFNSSTSILLTRYGHNVLFLPAIIALVYLLLRKKKVEYLRFLLITLFLMVFFLMFTVVNFYTYRYVTPMLGLVLLSSFALVQQVQNKRNILNVLYVVIVLAVAGYYTATKRGTLDIDLGYTQYLKVQKEMIQFCEHQGWYDKEFGTGFNMVMSMRDRHARMLSTDKNFKTHHLPGIQDRDYIIYDSTCWPNEMPKEEKEKLILIKRFEYKKHWGEIYQVASP